MALLRPKVLLDSLPVPAIRIAGSLRCIRPGLRIFSRESAVGAFDFLCIGIGDWLAVFGVSHAKATQLPPAGFPFPKKVSEKSGLRTGQPNPC